jgi:GDP-L-fucose synthase
MIYFGSGAEYDRLTMPPGAREEDFGAHVPTDDYGFSKYITRLAAEQAPNIYNLVVFACYGRHEDWEIRFPSNALCKALHGLPITMRQNVVFDYFSADDLCAIVRKFLLVERPSARHFNVCSGKPIDLLGIARLALEVTGRSLEIRIAQSGLGREYSGNNERLLAEIGGFEFTPPVRVLSELADWYRGRLSEIPRELLLTDK